MTHDAWKALNHRCAVPDEMQRELPRPVGAAAARAVASDTGCSEWVTPECWRKPQSHIKLKGQVTKSNYRSLFAVFYTGVPWLLVLIYLLLKQSHKNEMPALCLGILIVYFLYFISLLHVGGT